MENIIVYFAAVNLLGAVITAWDKAAARRGDRRVAEKILFAFCLLGGGVGVYLTMRLIQHKTLHRRFMWGIPLIIAGQCALGILLRWKFG